MSTTISNPTPDNSYATDVRKARRKGKGGTQEFFTPSEIVNKMCDKVPEQDWADPKKTFLEPSFGNGNFLVEIVRRRIVDYHIPWEDTLNTTYGVELMSDNVFEAKERIMKLLRAITTDLDERTAKKIMDKNLVCSDFFKWDFDRWKPIQEPKQLTLF